MAVATVGRTMPDTYFRLVHIRDEAHLDAAQGVIDRLLREDLDEGAEEYLDALSDLVETYETAHHPIPDASGADVLRELMAMNRLSQQQLEKAVGIKQSTISAILNGGRKLTMKHAESLASYFHVRRDAFLPASSPDRS